MLRFLATNYSKSANRLCMESEEKNAAITLAKGPAGEILSKFAAHYAKAFIFGEKPVKGKNANIRNGTVTLICLPERKVAVTCQHVIEEYRNSLAQNKNVVTQIGDTVIDPLSQLVDENHAVDLAVIELTDKQVEGITNEGEIGSRLVDGRTWPPTHVAASEVVMLAGFPGKYRRDVAYDEIVFGAFCAAGIRVHSAKEDYFTCQFEREYWVRSFGADAGANHLEPILGGMSGGPAFVDRGLRWEFGGFIYEHSADFDILYLRPANLINSDGTIKQT
jgi:hypothetical protein